MTTNQQHLIRCLLVLWKFGRPLNFDAELDVSFTSYKEEDQEHRLCGEPPPGQEPPNCWKLCHWDRSGGCCHHTTHLRGTGPWQPQWWVSTYTGRCWYTGFRNRLRSLLHLGKEAHSQRWCCFRRANWKEFHTHTHPLQSRITAMHHAFSRGEKQNHLISTWL
jgi:hypothetical protein